MKETFWKTVEVAVDVEVDVSTFPTEELLEELMRREADAPTRKELMNMLSPDLEPLLVDLYEGLRGTVVYDDIEKMLAKLFDITLGRIL